MLYAFYGFVAGVVVGFIAGALVYRNNAATANKAVNAVQTTVGDAAKVADDVKAVVK